MPTNDIITTDLVGYSVDSPLVELFELTIGPSGSQTTYYFHPGVEEDLSTLKFHPLGDTSKNTDSEANEYIALPMELTGVEATSDGASPRPVLVMANVTNVLRAELDDDDFLLEDIVGGTLTRRRTFAKYLVGGSDESSPEEFPIAKYVIDRLDTKSSTIISFELASPIDLENTMLPRRTVIGKYCSWIYQGRDTHKCGGCVFPSDSKFYYNGVEYDAFFDINDNPLVRDGAVSAGAWGSTLTYAKNEYAVYNSVTYQSKVDSNLNNTPGTNTQYWREANEYSTYSSSTAYTVGKYVKYDDKIWKAVVASTGKTPEDGSRHWNRVDLCSKTLSGCKARFGFKPITEGVGNQASVDKKLDIVLPFGAFPGSDKFK
jgi:lambda family phage minor tail protein L